MSITNINQTEKVKVLFRLLDNQENIETACSKAGLNIETTKKFLSLGSVINSVSTPNFS